MEHNSGFKIKPITTFDNSVSTTLKSCGPFVDNTPTDYSSTIVKILHTNEDISETPDREVLISRKKSIPTLNLSKRIEFNLNDDSAGFSEPRDVSGGQPNPINREKIQQLLQSSSATTSTKNTPPKLKSSKKKDTGRLPVLMEEHKKDVIDSFFKIALVNSAQFKHYFELIDDEDTKTKIIQKLRSYCKALYCITFDLNSSLKMVDNGLPEMSDKTFLSYEIMSDGVFKNSNLMSEFVEYSKQHTESKNNYIKNKNLDDFLDSVKKLSLSSVNQSTLNISKVTDPIINLEKLIIYNKLLNK
ncbi:hypothetical protein [Carp edema virus]|nr:hypothetical protein [Carp edema virus]